MRYFNLLKLYLGVNVVGKQIIRNAKQLLFEPF